MDRLARSAHDTVLLMLVCKNGTACSVTEPITDTPVGNLTKTYSQDLLSSTMGSQKEARMRKRRIEEGGWPHMAPLSYENHR